MLPVQPSETPVTPVTIFTCVKLRSGKKASCSGCGSRDLLVSLKQQLANSGLREITIRPTGCLKKCSKGPIVVLFAAKESLKKSPKKAWKKADARFKRLRVEDASLVLAAAKSLAGNI